MVRLANISHNFIDVLVSVPFQLGVERLAIFTDSKYLIDSISDWIFGWLSNDWRKSDGGRVKHKKQYRELLMAMEDMDIKWVSRWFNQYFRYNLSVVFA